VGDTRRRLEDLPRSRLVEQRLGRFGRPGVHPESSVLGECGLAQDRILRCGFRSLVGGDEETRTPDPLLAKEMLCQLSYVPVAGVSVVGVSGLEPETSALSGQCSNQLS
jgi:hypothetical protein